MLKPIAPVLVLAFLTVTTPGPSPVRAGEGDSPPVAFHLSAYLPDWRVGAIDTEACCHLTELIYFSVEPRPDGTIDRRSLKPESLRRLREIKDKHKLKLLLCAGGWGHSRGFAPMASSAASRDRFAAELTKFCVDNRFDGADLDWEHPKNDKEVEDYGKLLVAIKNAFRPHKFTLTIAAAGWQKLVPEGIEAVDRVHLMAYDGKGRHSTLDFAKADVARLVASGVPTSKITLGMPFYGRKVDQGDKAMTFAEIVRTFDPGPEIDEVGGFYFNGARMIEAKTRYAVQSKLAGVMFWELGQDARGDKSLLRAASKAAESPSKGRGDVRP